MSRPWLIGQAATRASRRQRRGQVLHKPQSTQCAPPGGQAYTIPSGNTVPLLLAAFLLAVPGQGISQALAQADQKAGAPKNKLDNKKEELKSEKEKLKEAEQRSKALQLDVEQINKERERIKARLQETAALIQDSEARMTSIEERLGELEAQERIVRGSLEQRHGQIAKLLATLQRMGRNPPPVMITRREDALQMVRSAMLIASAFPGLRKQALTLASRLNELVRVMTEIRSENKRLTEEVARHEDARTRLAGLMEEKKQSLAERRSELEDLRKTTLEISRNVTDLNDLIAKLDRAVTENTNLKQYNEKEAQVAALSPPPSSSIIELAPANLGRNFSNPRRIEPEIPFRLARASLPLPARGRKVLAFGEKTNFGGTSPGMVFETRNGAQITSPCDGWIVYAGEFRSYGQLLIINAGGGYHVLLAGLSHIDVQPGHFVLKSEPVGTMPNTPNATPQTSSQGSAPVLYVEFRKDGKPIDPAPWWVNPQKVNG